MIPVKLSLSGFLSYRDQVTVDFSKFELACISGQNGAGKSSLLDAITWALFGEARRKDDAVLNDNANAAEVTLEFEYEGGYYRVLRRKTRGKSTILEFNLRDEAGQWKVLTEHGLTKTEERIQDTLHLNYETFINASFFLQGKADQFTQQPPAKRKDILSNILQLNVWDEYKKETGERRKAADQTLAGIEGQLKNIEEELNQEPERKNSLKQFENLLKEKSEKRKAKDEVMVVQTKLVDALKHQEERLKELKGQLDETRQQHADHNAQLEAREKERTDYQEQTAHAEEIEAGYKRLIDVREELDKASQLESKFNAYTNDRRDVQAKINLEETRLRSDLGYLSDLKNKAEAAQKDAETANRDLGLARRVVEECSALVSKRNDLKEEQNELNRECAGLDQKRMSLQATSDEAHERIDHLEVATEGYCPLCESELSDEERINLIEKLSKEVGEIEGRLNANTQKINTNKKKMAAIAVELNKLSKVDNDHDLAKQRVFKIEAQLEKHNKTLSEWQEKYAGKFDGTQKKLVEDHFALPERQRLKNIDQEIAALGYNQADHNAKRDLEKELRPNELRHRNLETARAALGPLSRQIEDLKIDLARDAAKIKKFEESHNKENDAYQKSSANRPDIEALARELEQVKKEEEVLRDEVGKARERVDVLKERKEQQKQLRGERENIKQQIARLRQLEIAFGRNGVPAMLIDQELGDLQDQANSVLDLLSHGTMSVSISTQREYKDTSREDKKETLDILISDPAGTRPYEMFSGGEAFRVNFAIRLALSRVLARRAGARLQTLVIDEGFGSQDSDGRQRLIEAINLVRGDFAKIIVITHLEELKDAFPARIEVEKTTAGSTVQVMLA